MNAATLEIERSSQTDGFFRNLSKIVLIPHTICKSISLSWNSFVINFWVNSVLLYGIWHESVVGTCRAHVSE